MAAHSIKTVQKIPVSLDQAEGAILAHSVALPDGRLRKGCTLGATTALVQDWRAIRAVLDRAAERAGVESPSCSLPTDDSIGEAIAAGTDGLASDRALAFGADQMLLQHRALFDLLEARAEAREGL